LLADEAASISMFGDARHIRVDPATDEAADAVKTLIEASSAGNPVVLVAGNLRKESRLVKLAMAARTALAFPSYLPEGPAADRVAAELAREAGFRLEPRAAQALVAATAADRALMAREIEKLALYLDASPGDSKTADLPALAAIGVTSGESDLSAIVDAVMAGRAERVAAELALVGPTESISLVRALLRRLGQIAPLRAQVAMGQSPAAVMASAGKAIFWKDRDVVSGLLRRWTPEQLAAAIARLSAVERACKSPASAGMVLVGDEVLGLARSVSAAR